MADEHPDMTAAALAWQAAGCSVIRTAIDGTKAPLGTWTTYQHTAPTAETLRAWYTGGHPGIGVVCGQVSGHLEMLELEGRAVHDGIGAKFLDALDDHGLTDLKTRILAGYSEVSPSGGLHLYYRVEHGIGGNTKLAQRRGTDPATGRTTVEPLIETRGEGGFVVVAPSHGPVHPTGRPWRVAGRGTPADIPTITGDERDVLHAVAALFDELPPAAPIPDETSLRAAAAPGDGLAPGADYNARATWPDLLTPAGWTLVRQLGDRAYWRRPGKTIGVSAVTGGSDADYFWCWSTSTDLPAEQAMSKWRVYAHLHHGGDFPAAASALRAQGYGDRQPERERPVFTVLDGGAAAAVAAHPAPDAPFEETTYEHSDDGSALALIDRFGAVIRFCPERGRWLAWTGWRWEWCPSGGGVVREHCKRVARAMRATDGKAERWKQRWLSAIGTTATLTQAATDPRITVALDQLDARPLELNTPSGIVDLRSGRLRGHDPIALHTRITAAAPASTADQARWQQFLADTFAGHDTLPAYLQRLVGYSVTGIVRDHILPFCFGSGANGKGVFLEAIQKVLGDYATTAPSGFLMAHNYAGHETEIARLAGARMVVCSEVNEGDKFDEAKVKQLTGGDTLTARFMRMDHFSFEPTHKLWLMGNHQPTVTGGGHSFWRRLRMVSFDNTVPAERQVEDLQGILAEQHGAAILAWIVAGAAAYFTGGLAEPAEVRAATASYAASQDTVAQFVEECCRITDPAVAEHVQVRAAAVRAAYDTWCRRTGQDPVSATRLGRTLKARYGVTVTPGGRKGRFYGGITLLDTDEDDTEEDR